MRKITKAVRKLVVTIVGFSVLAAGLILIPLPGPGILVTILGLLILSWEFTWAERQLDRARAAHRKVVEKAKQKQAQSSKPPHDSA